jgi:hypothetical protein
MVATTTRISAKVNAARENRVNARLITTPDSGPASEVTRKMDKIVREVFFNLNESELREAIGGS